MATDDIQRFYDEKMDDAIVKLHSQILNDRRTDGVPAGDRTTIFAKDNGDRIEITHSKPLEDTLGNSLLAAIKWWHSGSVRYGNE